MTMSTSERAEVNRRNAQKSSGPKSAAGKDRSRFNAVKHGMRARQPILPGEDPLARQARLDAWTAQLEPRDDVEQFLVGRAVNLSWQLERAERACAARLADAAAAAPTGWPTWPTRSSRWADASSGTRWARCRSTPTWATGPAGCSSASPGPTRSTTPTSRPGSSTGSRARRWAAPGCWTAGASCARCWRTAGPGSRRTGCGRSGCWASSRWTPSRTTGS